MSLIIGPTHGTRMRKHNASANDKTACTQHGVEAHFRTFTAGHCFDSDLKNVFNVRCFLGARFSPCQFASHPSMSATHSLGTHGRHQRSQHTACAAESQCSRVFRHARRPGERAFLANSALQCSSTSPRQHRNAMRLVTLRFARGMSLLMRSELSQTSRSGTAAHCKTAKVFDGSPPSAADSPTTHSPATSATANWASGSSGCSRSQTKSAGRSCVTVAFRG